VISRPPKKYFSRAFTCVALASEQRDDFLYFPNMIGDSRCHRRSHTKRLMHSAEIVVGQFEYSSSGPSISRALSTSSSLTINSIV
jgi:hypothetical protein